MVIVVLHTDIQLHQVAAGKGLGEVRHLDVQRVPRPLLVVELANQVHVALQTVHHERPILVRAAHNQVSHLALQQRGLRLIRRADGADNGTRRSPFHCVQGHEEHIWLLVGPGVAENLRRGRGFKRGAHLT